MTDDELLDQIPETIDTYSRRVLRLDNLVVIEYSTAFSAGRFVGTQSKPLNNTDNIFLEVVANNLADAVEEMKTKLYLRSNVNSDFPRYLNFGVSPALNFVGVPIPLKPIEIFFIVSPFENFFHVGIISSNLDRDITVIPDFVKMCLDEYRKNETFHFKVHDLDTREFVFTNMVYLYSKSSIIDLNGVKNAFSKYEYKVNHYNDEFRVLRENAKKPDFFICHDSRDKVEVVEPLVCALQDEGLKVWYDKYNLKVGDSLSEKIQDGISNCRFGVLVLSKNFLSNEKWAKNELQSFTARQVIENNKVLLPIWHNISEEDLKQYSFWLLDKLAGNTKDGFDVLAKRLKEVLQ